MSEEIREEILREAVEFVKFLRHVLVLTIAVVLLLLIPINIVYGEPIAFYLLKNTLRSPILNLFSVYQLGGLGNANSTVILIAGSPAGPIRVILSSALFFGILISSPLTLYLFYRYLKPALYPHERGIAKRIVLLTALLFYSGILYGLIVIAPLTINILMYFGSVIGVEPYISVAEFYEFIVVSVLATAVGFLIPLAVYIIGRVFHLNLNLRRYWRYIFVIGYAVTAVITPDPTPITALLIIGPPLILSVVAEGYALKRV